MYCVWWAKKFQQSSSITLSLSWALILAFTANESFLQYMSICSAVIVFICVYLCAYEPTFKTQLFECDSTSFTTTYLLFKFFWTPCYTEYTIFFVIANFVVFFSDKDTIIYAIILVIISSISNTVWFFFNFLIQIFFNLLTCLSHFFCLFLFRV